MLKEKLKSTLITDFWHNKTEPWCFQGSVSYMKLFFVILPYQLLLFQN